MTTSTKQVASKAKAVSAAQVRAHIKSKPSLVPADKGGKLWRNVKGRGALHADLISIYNKDKRGKAKYVVGEGTAVKRVTVLGPNGRKFNVPAAELRALDGSTGKNGRISKATKAAYVAQVLAAEASV